MSYYTGQGDYYSGKGDPGFGSILGGIIGTVGGLLPGPAGMAARAVGSAIGGGSRAPTPQLRLPGGSAPRIQAQPTPGMRGVAQRLIPGGQSGYQCGSGNSCGTGFHMDKTTQTKCVRNRKTNYTNPKALSRATKRVDGFVSVAKKALKSTKYKVVNESFKANWRKPLKK